MDFLDRDVLRRHSFCCKLNLVIAMACHPALTIAFDQLIFSSVVLLFCGKYLERAWGSRELLKYVLITGVVSNIVTCLGIIMTFYMSGEGDYL